MSKRKSNVKEKLTSSCRESQWVKWEKVSRKKRKSTFKFNKVTWWFGLWTDLQEFYLHSHPSDTSQLRKCFFSFVFYFLWFLSYLGSISVLLRGQGAFGWAVTTKMCSRRMCSSPRYFFFLLLFILLITITGTTISTASTCTSLYHDERPPLWQTIHPKRARNSSKISSSRRRNKRLETRRRWVLLFVFFNVLKFIYSYIRLLTATDLLTPALPSTTTSVWRAQDVSLLSRVPYTNGLKRRINVSWAISKFFLVSIFLLLLTFSYWF